MSTSIFQLIPPHLFPHWCPYICSLCLCLYFCFENRFIGTIFLDSMYYMCICDPANPLSGIHPEKTIITRHMHLHVHCSTIYNRIHFIESTFWHVRERSTRISRTIFFSSCMAWFSDTLHICTWLTYAQRVWTILIFKQNTTERKDIHSIGWTCRCRSSGGPTVPLYFK